MLLSDCDKKMAQVGRFLGLGCPMTYAMRPFNTFYASYSVKCSMAVTLGLRSICTSNVCSGLPRLSCNLRTLQRPHCMLNIVTSPARRTAQLGRGLAI